MSNRIVWIFQKDNLLPGDDKLIAAAKAAGHGIYDFTEIYSTKHLWLQGNGLSHLPVIVRGGINFLKWIGRYNLYPGVYCNWEKLRCVSYYPKYGDLLLNRDYFLIPFGELHSQPEILGLFKSKRVFARPDKGTKQFTGTTIDLTDDWPAELFSDLPSSDLCLFSSAKHIVRECRYVCRKDDVISGNGYTGDDSYVRNMIRAAKWHPDNLYIVDLAFDENNIPSIVELNSFSASGLEGWFDYDLIVKEAVEQAWEDYKD